jgi:glycosyltransferase involved in cell wall biosynthesis
VLPTTWRAWRGAVTEETRATGKPVVSVIIPVYNDAARLESCLEQLERQTYPREAFEVVVVDNESDDGVEAVVEGHPGVRLAKESRPGSYAARNRGIQLSRGTILAFTDSDCLPAQDWIRAGVDCLEQLPGVGMVGGRVCTFPRTSRITTLVELHQCVCAMNNQGHLERRNYSLTANLFAHARVFESVGLFDAELFSGGDVEWGQRVHAANIGQAYGENVVVRHPARRSLREIRAKCVRTTGGRWEKSRKQGRRQTRNVGYALRTPFVKLKRYHSNPLLRSRIHQLGFFWVECYLATVRLREIAKLSLGARPRR